MLSLMSPNMLRAPRYAAQNRDTFTARVAANSGTVVDTTFIYEMYKLGYEQFGDGFFPRRVYSSNAAVKLNGISNTNLLTYSNDFSNAAWNKTDLTPSEYLSPLPSGYTSAYLMTEGSAGTAFTRQASASVTAGATVCAQILVRRGNTDFLFFNLGNNTGSNAGGCWLNTSTGVVSNVTNAGTATGAVAYSIDMGNGYWKLVISCAVPTLTSYFLIFASASAAGSSTRVANSTYIVTGAQIQTGTIATDHIETGATTASATQSYVQTLYDLNNASPVDAVQTTATNQPYYFLDTTLNRRVPLFDGSNDFIPVNDLGIFNAQGAGTLLAVTSDLARTSGDGTHVIIQTTGGIGTTRGAIFTRLSAANNFTVSGSRVDGEAGVTQAVSSTTNYNLLGNLLDWSGNNIKLVTNGTISAGTTFTGGAGLTSATNGTFFNIGATNATTNRLNGYITDIIADRTVFTATQLAALRAFYKQYNSQLP